MSFRLLSRPTILSLMTVLAVSATAAAVAQDTTWMDGQFKDRATPQRAAKKNDAYRPAESGPGLGTLSSPGADAVPQAPAWQAPSQPPMAVGRGYEDNYRSSGQDSQSPSYAPPPAAPYQSGQSYGQGYGQAPAYGQRPDYAQPAQQSSGAPYPPGAPSAYDRGANSGDYATNNRGFGQPYSPPPPVDSYGDERGGRPPYASNQPYKSGEPRPPYREEHRDGTFSTHEIKSAGHNFFGSISQGVASVIEYAFQRQGRPNGYILGEDAGGAFVAGLRYGEGVLYTKDAGTQKVYWQGPSLGYDVGAEGSKVMVLVYNLRDPAEIFDRFGGVAGSAYMIGGVGINFQTKDHLVLAPIRAGIGLRLGANVGYLKYTPTPTWNPF